MIQALGLLFSLIWLVCHVIVLIHAFKSSLLSGLACLCIPCFGIYYLFAKFEHSSKGLITIGYLFGGIVGGSMQGYNGYSGYSGYGHHDRTHQQHR